MGKSKATAQRAKQPPSNKPAIGKYVAYAVLVLVVVFFAAIRFRLRTMPLERDEGEYAYAGQLMLEGIAPYKLAYTMKLPGTQALYAAIMAVFGQTPAGIHLGLLLVNAATTLLVYMLAKRLSGRLAGVVAAASYAVLSTSVLVLGFAAHATHFVVLFAVAGILLLLKAAESGRMGQFFTSGCLLGLAFLMKQPGLMFAVFGGLYLLKSEWKRPIQWKSLFAKAGSYSAGVVLPFALTCLILLRAGVFKNFWFWVFTYARQYASEVGFSEGVQVFAKQFVAVMGPSIGVWILAAVGLTALWWHRESRAHASLMVGFLLFSFMAVCPGLYFRKHYFILMLPAVALLAGMAVHSATQMLARARSGGLALSGIPVVLFIAAFGTTVAAQSVFMFQMNPQEACQRLYITNPFPEAVVVAEYLSAHTSASDQIGVLGSEPEIFFYAKRHSATGFIYVYGLLEPQEYALEMQKQMFSELKAARPQFVVLVKTRFSWLPRDGSIQAESFSSLANNFLRASYEPVGAAERVGDQIEYHWGEDLKEFRPRSQNVVGIFKRKD